MTTQKKCGVCSRVISTTTSTEDHRTTTVTSSSWSYNTIFHWHVTTTTCSYCDYSTTGTANKGKHNTSGSGGCCGSCGYQDIGSLPLTFASTSECEDCMTKAVNEQDVLVDDKKNRYEKLFYVDEKKYMSNGYEAKNFQI